MQNYIKVAEAASYLGVSKETLRNWDKIGKLKAIRHPMNNYRVYEISDLDAIKKCLAGEDILSSSPDINNSNNKLLTDVPKVESKNVKRLIFKLHSILRNNDGESNIIQRFDELTKLLFLKLYVEKNETNIFDLLPFEESQTYAARIKEIYSLYVKRQEKLFPEKFRGIRCSDNAIYECGRELSKIFLANQGFDIKGLAYEEVIKGTFDKSDNQQFFTPPNIVNFMVSMMRSYLTGRTCDPACGTAGFLAEIARQKIDTEKIMGFEIDERLQWVSNVNLLLHGCANFEIHYLDNGGTLGKAADKFINGFDAIITNPPFGSDFNDSEKLKTYKLGEGKTSRRRGVLFIERCWEMLKDDGVLAIIIDEGVLNLPSNTDVRKFILEKFDILSIVSLPDTAFQPYASVNASILFLMKIEKKPKSTEVFYAKAENVGRKSNGDDDYIYDKNAGYHLNSDFPDIVKQWENKKKGKSITPSDIYYVANVIQNIENDESLRLDFQYHHPSRNISKELLNKSKYPLVYLSEICDERNENYIPSADMETQMILYTGLANIESKNGIAYQIPTPTASIKSAVKRYEPGDIVFARMRPNLRKVALMAFEDGGYVSPECTVLIVRKNKNGVFLIMPEVLATILRSDLVFGQILHLVSGAGRPRLSVKDLRQVRIPLIPVELQIQANMIYKSQISTVNMLREKADALIEEAKVLEYRSVNELTERLVDNKNE